MKQSTWFRQELWWKFMAVVALALAWSARAEPPLALEQGSQAVRQRLAARRPLATSSQHSMALGQGGAIWVWGFGSGQRLGTWPEIGVGSATPVRMPRMQGAVSLSMGTSHSLALLEDGTVEAWGNNFSGQLGDGAMGYRDSRVKARDITDAVGISAGGSHSLAVRRDGSVWAWGDNARGQLGDGTKTRRAQPMAVPGLADMVAVAAGSSHSLALRADGTVWAWGDNFRGQLGDGTTQPRLTPVQVLGLTNVVSIEARDLASYAVREDGTVWAWGSNHTGSFPGSYQTTPSKVEGLERVVAVAAAPSHALALRWDGSVWAWGSNSSGQLGNGTQDWQRQPPQPVPGVHGAVAVAAGQEHSLVMRWDGSLLAWGYNRYGTLGTGTDRRTAPVPVAGLTDVRAIAENSFLALAVRGDGSVWQWGVVGTGGLALQASPARMEEFTQAVSAAVGYSHALVLRQDGTVWAWGDNFHGQLGDGILMGEHRGTPAPVQGLEGVVAVAAGDYHTLALKQDGTVWAWGANYFGQLGDMTLDDQPLPVQVQGLEGVAAIFASEDLSVAVLSDGTVRYWGSHWSIWYWGDMMPRLPEPVPELTQVVKVDIDIYGLTALRQEGTVWRWLHPMPWETVPPPAFPLEELTGAVDLIAKDNLTQLLRADGAVWSAGSNYQGQLGYPSTNSYSLELRQVPGLTGVVALSASYNTVHALREDGTLVGWGSNATATIGDGVSPLHLRPTRVPLPCTPRERLAGGELLEQQCHPAP